MFLVLVGRKDGWDRGVPRGRPTCWSVTGTSLGLAHYWRYMFEHRLLIMFQVSGVVERAEAARTLERREKEGLGGEGDGGDGAHVSFPGV